MGTSHRIHWLDAARAFAIISVVMCHSVESVYTFDVESIGTLSLASRIIAFCGFTFGRIGVPLFLLMTGYLLLDRDWDSDAMMTFWKRRWLPLLLCVESWIVLYSVFLYATGGAGNISVPKVIRCMLFVDGVDMGHFWYVPMIVGLYLFLPIMGAALRHIDPRTIAVPLVVLGIFAFVVPIVIHVFAALKIPIELAVRLDFGYSGGVYGIYLLCGWCAKRGVFKKYTVPVLALTALILFVGCVEFQVWCYGNGHAYNIWYTNALLLLCGISAFELFSRLPYHLFVNQGRHKNGEPDSTLFGRICYLLSYYSFAIYLVHFPIQILLRPYIEQIPTIMPVQTTIAFCSVFVSSALVSWVLSKIPLLGKPLLYLK